MYKCAQFYKYTELVFSYSSTINPAMMDRLGAYYITFVAVPIHFMCFVQDWEIIKKKRFETLKQGDLLLHSKTVSISQNHSPLL